MKAPTASASALKGARQQIRESPCVFGAPEPCRCPRRGGSEGLKVKGERLQCTVQQNQCLLQHGSNLSQVEINTTGQYAANLTVAVSASDTNAAHSRLGQHVFATEVEKEEDLLQFTDRAQWYEAKWAAADQPEWNPSRVLRSEQVTLNQRIIVLEAEISREKVYLKNAYKHIGQQARVRVGSGLEFEVTVCTSPFSTSLNKDALFKLKGDIFAGQVKKEVEDISIKAELGLLVSEDEAPELYNLEEDDPVELGPFKGYGLGIRGQIAGIFRYPTIVIFCEGAGIAVAKSLIEAPEGTANLNLGSRADVRMYYKAPNDAEFAFRDKFEAWKELGCEVITTTDSFQDAFDDDDTLVYEPNETAAIILTGGDKDSEKVAMAVAKEAELEEIVLQSEEKAPTVYLATGLDEI